MFIPTCIFSTDLLTVSYRLSMKRKEKQKSLLFQKLKAVQKEEAALFYSENKLDKETRCIGYLRADFGKSGNEFSTNFQKLKIGTGNYGLIANTNLTRSRLKMIWIRL